MPLPLQSPRVDRCYISRRNYLLLFTNTSRPYDNPSAIASRLGRTTHAAALFFGFGAGASPTGNLPRASRSQLCAEACPPRRSLRAARASSSPTAARWAPLKGSRSSSTARVPPALCSNSPPPPRCTPPALYSGSPHHPMLELTAFAALLAVTACSPSSPRESARGAAVLVLQPPSAPRRASLLGAAV